MNPIIVFSIITVYFSILIFISYLTSRKSNLASFFTGNKKSPWYLVAFGMIGASLSGVTFISIPGEVGTSNFYYFQLVLGYLVGYAVIILFLLPLYYRLNLVSIYTYLNKRFGVYSHKTGAGFFILSRVIGASFRLFLVANVLQLGLFNALGIPFYVTVPITIALIWVYTYKAGIKTIVWTDTFQTIFMLASVIITIYYISANLNLNFSELVNKLRLDDNTKIFDWDWKSKTNFFKQFIAGAFIAIVMTGLDQDMMQKNLTCKNLKDAQKNMFWFSLVLIPVNLLFLSLGALLYIYTEQNGISLPDTSDKLFPMLALQYFSLFAGIIFLLGIISAAFSSADSALTALTTSFAFDFLKMNLDDVSAKAKRNKTLIHISFSIIIFAVILIFNFINKPSVVTAVFKAASYTYGPILGIFAFGLLTKLSTKDKFVPIIAVLSPIFAYILNIYSKQIFRGYEFGFELLVVNGLITFLGLLIFANSRNYVKI
jgi:Na+/proline symporter